MSHQISPLEKTFLLWVLSETTNPGLLDLALERLKQEYTPVTELEDSSTVDPGLKGPLLGLCLAQRQELI